MKISQSVILLTFKGGDTYIFGSLAAIYAMFTPEQLGITYSALRNAVSKYIKEHNVNGNNLISQVIYDTNKSKKIGKFPIFFNILKELFFLRSKIIIRRAPLLLADKD